MWGGRTASGVLAVLAWLTCVAGAAAVEIQFDYTYDTGGFFSDPARRKALERAGSYFLRLRDQLTAINPFPPLNTISFEVSNPASGETLTVDNPKIAANQIRVYVGGRDLAGSTIGLGGPAGWSANGTNSFLNAASRRGQGGEVYGDQATEYQVAIGSIAFDNLATWNFNLSGPVTGKDDFLTIALHELGHVLGVGTADSWRNQVDLTSKVFLGPEAESVYGGPVPVDEFAGHWAVGTQGTVNGQSQTAAMDPAIRRGTRRLFTDVDLAGMADIGWVWAGDGDLDLDGDADSADLVLFLDGWTGDQPAGVGTQTFLNGDMDYDGDTDASDLVSLLAGWTGSSAGAATSSAIPVGISSLARAPDAASLVSGVAVVPEPTAGMGWMAAVAWILVGYRTRVSFPHQPQKSPKR